MKNIVFLAAFFLLTIACQAQEEFALLQYYNNPVLTNPAFSGVDNSHDVYAHFRRQWAGFEDAPTSYTLSYNGRFGERFGAGAILFSDRIGNLNRYSAALSYAYHLNLDRDSRISIGLSGRYLNYSVDTDLSNNPLYDASDEVLQEAISGISGFDAGLGLAYLRDNFYAGVSVPNMVASRFNSGTSGSTLSIFSYYTMIAGYRIEIDDTTIEPILFVSKIVNAPFQASIMVKAGFREDQIIGGLGFNSALQSATALIGSRFYQNMYFYYSYDFTFREFNNYNSGSHEITLNLKFATSVDDNDNSNLKPIYY